MMRRIILWSFVIILGFGVWFVWEVRQFQKPFQVEDIPQWQVVEGEEGEWHLSAIDEPQRTTQAWFEGNPDGLQCDTLILVGGLEEGKNLAVGGAHLPHRANIISMRHPINNFLNASPWDTWGFWQWLQIPQKIKTEIAHTVGAYKALADYVYTQGDQDSRLTKRVMLAGGSFGGPFPVIVTSFQEEIIASLMVIYGFTNYTLVIERELGRQGLIHFDLDHEAQSWNEHLQQFGVAVLAKVLGFSLGNMLKYGSMEFYFPQITNTPAYFINGRSDHLVPKEAFDPMWNSASEPKYQVWVEGDHIRPGEPEEVRALVNHLQRWASSQQLWKCEK